MKVTIKLQIQYTRFHNFLNAPFTKLLFVRKRGSSFVITNWGKKRER